MVRLASAELFDPSEVAILHVIGKVTRRCFLFGFDPVSGKNFDHRKVWIEEQLKTQAANFGIDLLSMASLSNHFHLILRSRPDVVATWDDTEVARRWLMLCPKRKNEDRSARCDKLIIFFRHAATRMQKCCVRFQPSEISTCFITSTCI